MNQLQLLAIISLLMVGAISNVYAGGPRLDYPDDATEEGADCWVDGYDAGFAGKYDKNTANKCKDKGEDNYNSVWGYACRDAGYMPDECESFKKIYNINCYKKRIEEIVMTKDLKTVTLA